jgi:hypothetical protein
MSKYSANQPQQKKTPKRAFSPEEQERKKEVHLYFERKGPERSDDGVGVSEVLNQKKVREKLERTRARANRKAAAVRMQMQCDRHQHSENA